MSGGVDAGRANASRSFWLKHLHQWHWISSAICLIGMILFAVTGITLNHAADIEAKPVVTERDAVMPSDVLAQLPTEATGGPLPASVAQWVAGTVSVDVRDKPAEWSDGEVYVALARPGGDAWLTIDRGTGDVHYEDTNRGWVSYVNDLHKGRNSGVVWSWFIDIFAVACLIFCVTGLFLLHLHAGARPVTWPLVGFGLAAPAVLAILFIH